MIGSVEEDTTPVDLLYFARPYLYTCWHYCMLEITLAEQKCISVHIFLVHNECIGVRCSVAESIQLRKRGPENALEVRRECIHLHMKVALECAGCGHTVILYNHA